VTWQAPIRWLGLALYGVGVAIVTVGTFGVAAVMVLPVSPGVLDAPGMVFMSSSLVVGLGVLVLVPGVVLLATVRLPATMETGSGSQSATLPVRGLGRLVGAYAAGLALGIVVGRVDPVLAGAAMVGLAIVGATVCVGTPLLRSPSICDR
jgi:hypothetical protein